MRKIWKLHESNVKSEFSSYVNKYKQNTQENASVQSYLDILKWDLLGLEIGIVDGQEAQLDIEKQWWFNDDISNNVYEKEWKGVEAAKQKKYLQTKKKTSRNLII